MDEIKKIENSEPDYEGFVLHVREWVERGYPYSSSDLAKLAEEYHTPNPNV